MTGSCGGVRGAAAILNGGSDKSKNATVSEKKKKACCGHYNSFVSSTALTSAGSEVTITISWFQIKKFVFQGQMFVTTLLNTLMTTCRGRTVRVSVAVSCGHYFDARKSSKEFSKLELNQFW